MTQTNGIGNQPLLHPVIGRAERNNGATKQDADPASPGAATARTDGTSLSGLGSMLATATSATSDVRTDKIAALKSAIDSGSYRVPAADVADKIINSMLG